MSPHTETSQYDTGDRDGAGDRNELDEPGGPPYRAIAMVLLAAVVVAVGIGLAQLFGGEDTTPTAEESSTSQTEQQPAEQSPEPAPSEPTPAPAPAGEEGQQPATGDEPASPAPQGQPAPGPADPAAVPAVGTVPVQIFNNSTVSGLAGRTGDTLRTAGFAVSDVSNLPSREGVIPESAAFYGVGPGEQQAAQAIAGQLGIPAKPRPADLAVSTPGVIVIVTQDLAR